MQVADIGDVPINTFDLKKSVDIITDYYDDVLRHDVIPLTLGGIIRLPGRSCAQCETDMGLWHWSMWMRMRI